MFARGAIRQTCPRDFKHRSAETSSAVARRGAGNGLVAKQRSGGASPPGALCGLIAPPGKDSVHAMNRHVNAIAGRLSLRPPQRESLEILHRITEIAPPKKGADRAAALATIGGEYPNVTDFERDFPSLCFALATGVGKTRLMGAFISYLHLAHGLKNFFVLAPNLTIYNKLQGDFTPHSAKYVFKGIAEFATDPPAIITGDNTRGWLARC